MGLNHDSMNHITDKINSNILLNNRDIIKTGLQIKESINITIRSNEQNQNPII